MFEKEKFANILKRIKETYDSQEQFAFFSGIGRTSISQYMNCKLSFPPKPKLLEKIANSSKGITSYEELMQICGYIKSPNSAAYEFSIETDQKIIDSIINYAILKNIQLDKIQSDKYILNLLQNLENLDKNVALNLVKQEVCKFKAVYGINKEKTETNFSNSATVFIYGTIPAGIPMECIEDIIDTEEIDASMLKGGKQYFGLKIKGDSMYPEYLDKDTIILRKQDDCESGDDCVVMVNGNDGTFKRVFKNENGIILQPLNNSYQPMIYTNEQVETLPVRILGKVVELRRKK